MPWTCSSATPPDPMTTSTSRCCDATSTRPSACSLVGICVSPPVAACHPGATASGLELAPTASGAGRPPTRPGACSCCWPTATTATGCFAATPPSFGRCRGSDCGPLTACPISPRPFSCCSRPKTPGPKTSPTSTSCCPSCALRIGPGWRARWPPPTPAILGWRGCAASRTREGSAPPCTRWREPVRFAERLVGRDGDGVAFLAFGEDLEQQLGAATVQLHVVQLVDAQKVDAAVAADGLGAWEAGVVDAAGGATPVTVVAFGQQQLDQEAAVGELLAFGGVGELGEAVADGGQAQQAAGLVDGGVGGLLGDPTAAGWAHEVL